jgi:hypothetical protein
MPQSRDQDSAGRPGWVDKTAHITIGVAAGTFVNVFSDHAGARGLAVAAIAAGSFSIAARLRRRSRSPLSRYAARSALCGAVAGSMGAATVSGSTATAATITAVSVVIGATALIMQTDLGQAVRLGLSMIAALLTATVFGSGAGLILRGDERTGLGFLALGVLSLGVAFWVDHVMRHASGGTGWDQPLVGLLSRHYAFTMLAAGPVALIMGWQTLLVGLPFRALTTTVVAMSLLLAGIAVLAGREALLTASILMFGVGTLANGASLLAEAAMFGTMGLVIGTATVALGIGHLRPTLMRVREKLVGLAKEPGDEEDLHWSRAARGDVRTG